MEVFLITVHSWIRWIVVLLGVFLVIQGIIGMSNNSTFKGSHNGMSAAFLGTFHLQVVIGLVLYFISPKVSFVDMKTTMGDPFYRFWAVEHITTMLIAAVLVTIGRVKLKKAATDKGKFKAMAIWFGIALLLVFVTIVQSVQNGGAELIRM